MNQSEAYNQFKLCVEVQQLKRKPTYFINFSTSGLREYKYDTE